MWRRPPLLVLVLAILMIALAETAGALMGRYRAALGPWITEAVSRRPAVHGLSGNAGYDAELIPQIVFQAEAGLSFFHTHGEGMGLVVLAGGTIVSSLVAWRAMRGLLHVLLEVSSLFPLGFLASAAFTLTMGKDPGAEFAERWLLIPTGSAAIAAFAILGVALAAGGIRRRRDGGAPAQEREAAG